LKPSKTSNIPGLKALGLLLALCLLLAACGPAATSTPVPTSPTATLVATDAPTLPPPTDTPLPTDTPTLPPPTAAPPPTGTVKAPAAPAEVEIRPIPLTGPAAEAEAEFSGMAWYGDHLILLPQYPGRFEGGDDGALLTLPRAEIVAFLDGTLDSSLTPSPLPLAAPGLAGTIRGFEGYEAIAFDGDRAYLTIEASPGASMRGYLVAGRIAPDLSSLVLDPDRLVEIELQAGLNNQSDEALLVASAEMLTFHEANGAAVNPNPVAHRFGLDLAPAGSLPLPNVEYRLTDVTALDDQGRFWAINYFFPGDVDLLPQVDPLAGQYGQGASHAQYDHVERMIHLRYDKAGVHLLDEPPIQLQLTDEARNWEGIVRLEGRGFLLVTDKFPETILAFVPWP
jgi:hypothetical protein